VYLYVDLLLTDFNGDSSMRHFFGWSLVCILGGTVAINLVRLVYKVGSSIRLKVKRAIFRHEIRNGKTVSLRPEVSNTTV
jgi:hypothetical protein